MSENFTSDDLKAIEAAIAKGVKTVKYSDKEITYRDLDEMIKTRDIIRNCLGLNSRDGRKFATHRKGFC